MLWNNIWCNPFDRMLKKARSAQAKRVLLCWNRGLGDIPLGVYGLVHRVREFLPDAEVCVVTRQELEDGFRLLAGITLFIDPTWKRWVTVDVDETLQRLGIPRESFDLIVEKPDPTKWLRHQIGKITPMLCWDPAWDVQAERFSIPKSFRTIAVHVHTETGYALWRNWPNAHWQDLFSLLEKEEVQVLLFGLSKEHKFAQKNIIDLRGETTLYEMLSLIKNRCTHLVALDGGVLAMCYYLDSSFPLNVVTLWANREHGILRQKVTSPNPLLHHIPLVAPQNDLNALEVVQVFEAVMQ